MTRKIVPALACLLLAIAAAGARAGELDITIEGAKGDAPILGQVFVDSFSFAVKQGGVASFKIDPANGKATAVVRDLAPGRYAIAVFQDLDRDGKLAESFFGVPKEPYGFSRDAGGGTGPPGFDAAAVEVGADPQAITIHLR